MHRIGEGVVHFAMNEKGKQAEQWRRERDDLMNDGASVRAC